MAKINPDTLTEAIKTILDESLGEERDTPRRKFLETVELQVGLKNFDPSRDKRINGSVKLPYAPKKTCRICLFGNAAHIDEAKSIDLDFRAHDELKGLKKQKKQIKKLAKGYDAFLASSNLIKQVPRLIGPILNKIGKFPVSVPAGVGNVEAKVADLKNTVKFALKFKAGMPMALACAIGNVEMTAEELETNIRAAINYLLTLMKKQWQNIRRIHIKTTMGKPQKIYGL